MPPTFLVIPQWQGSGSSRALQLQDGAAAIQGDLPSSSTVVVDVPLGAGESLGSGIRRLTSLQIVRDRVADALRDVTDVVITIGGDCSVDLAPVSHAHGQHPGNLALVWLDAHPDVNTVASSSTGAFHGMILSTLSGDGHSALIPENPIPPSSVILAGTRSLDDAEADWVADHGIRMMSPNELTPESLVEAVAATGASAVYLHIDLDVIDPAEFVSLGFPEPFGISIGNLTELIRAVTARFTLAGAAITEFAPPSTEAAEDDLPAILRIIGALTSKP